MGEIVIRDDQPIEQQSEEAYLSIRGYVIDAQRQVYSAVNAAMVTAYWNIGKSIYEVCGESDRAAYGKQVLKYISERLTALYELSHNSWSLGEVFHSLPDRSTSILTGGTFTSTSFFTTTS